MAQTIGARIQIEGSDKALQTLVALEKEFADVSKEVRTLQAAGKSSEPALASLRGQQEKLRLRLAETKKEIKEQTKAFRDAEKQLPTSSIAALEQRYNRLRNEYKNLSVQVRQSKLGDAMAKEMRQIRNEVTLANRAMGQQRGGLGASLTQVAVGYFGVTQAVAFARRAITASIRTAAEFEEELRKLSSITGLVDDDLRQLAGAAIRMSFEFGTAGKEILTGFSLVGSALPELLKAPAALAEVTKQAEILALASGLTLPQSVEALTKTMNQFGLTAFDAAEAVDILATSQQLGTARVDSLAESIKNVGSVLRVLNLDLDTGNALLQALAKGGIDGAEAGIKLRNVLLAITATGRDDLNPSITDINTILDTLAEEYSDVGNATNLFKQQNVAAALTLINQRDVVKNLSGTLNEQGNALSQAATNTDTLATAWDRAGATFASTVASGTFLNTFLKTLGNTIGDIGQIFSEGTFLEGLSALANFSNPLQVGLLKQRVKADADFAKQREEDLKTWDQYTEFLGTSTQALELLTDEEKEYQREAAIMALVNEGTAQTFGQYKERVKELNEALTDLVPGSAAAVAVQKELDDINNKLSRSTKKVIEAFAQGSIGAIQTQIKKLNEDLIKSTSDTARVEISNTILQLETQLKNIQDRANALKSLIAAESALVPGADEIAGATGAPKTFEDALEAGEFTTQEDKLRQLEELENRFRAQALEADKQLKEDREKVDDEFTDTVKENVERRNALQVESAEVLFDALATIGAHIADFFASEEKNAREFLKTILLTLVDALEKTILISIAESTAKSIATFGPVLGAIRSAAAAALIKIAAAGVRASIQSFYGGGQVQDAQGRITHDQANISGQRGGDSVLAKVKPGETVLTQQQQDKLKAITRPSILADIGVPGFTSTGLAGNIPAITPESYVFNGNVNMSEDQMRQFAGIVAQHMGDSVTSAMSERYRENERFKKVHKLSRA